MITTMFDVYTVNLQATPRARFSQSYEEGLEGLTRLLRSSTAIALINVHIFTARDI
jgi:hypothetical protein